MGNQSSKNKELEGYLKHFSDEERNAIFKLFSTISQQNKAFSETQFLAYVKGKVTEVFGDMLFRAIPTIKENPDCFVDLVCFVRALAVFLKGTQDEVGIYLCRMMRIRSNCSNLQLQQFLREIANQYLKIAQPSTNYCNWNFTSTEETTERLTQMFYFNLLNKRKNVKDLWESSETSFSQDELEQMFFSESFLTKVFRNISSCLFPVLESGIGSLLPDCVGSVPSESSVLLDLPSVLMLNQSLPSQLNSRWQLLYSTSLHGQSFSMLLGHIMQKGPTIIVIKDKEGHTFGGFSSQSWELKPTFTGKEDSFVFTLSPVLATYSSTGYNANYTYLCMHQHTLPNGLGFGGQMNNFGLWLDCEFEIGHSTPSCSTFSSPQLSGSRQYKLDELQAWGVGPPPTTATDQDKAVPKKSILDADVGAKAILTMVNKFGASEAVREEDEKLEKEAAFNKSS